jgi:hypothetical protein
MLRCYYCLGYTVHSFTVSASLRGEDEDSKILTCTPRGAFAFIFNYLFEHRGSQLKRWNGTLLIIYHMKVLSITQHNILHISDTVWQMLFK